MAYNHGREDRKWRIWKEAEEKLLRECGVDEATIEQIRMGVASFIVQYRITKLLKSTLFVKLPAIRFHILTSFLVGKLVVPSPLFAGQYGVFQKRRRFFEISSKIF